MRFEGFVVKQEEEDADALIIKSAIEISEMRMIENTATDISEFKKLLFIIVGQDIDLSVLLNQLSDRNSSIYFLNQVQAM